MAEGETLVNSLIGAVIIAVTAEFIPFAPLFAGGVAGYLQGGSRTDGVRVGTIAGLIAFVPVLLIAALLVFGLSIVSFGAVESFLPFALGGIVVGFMVAFLFVYIVGLSALGGWLGNYLKHDTEMNF